jgi:hypothetical protein
MIEHPIRNEQINTWCDPSLRQDEYRWLAKFGIGRNFPICFNAASEAEVIAKAEAFRAKTIAQNEAAYAARVANAEKGRAARASAKRAVEP